MLYIKALTPLTMRFTIAASLKLSKSKSKVRVKTKHHRKSLKAKTRLLGNFGS